MATYPTAGYVQLNGVTYTGGEGEPGSTLEWTSYGGSSSSNLTVNDVDEDGLMDAGTDTLSTIYVFSGYTITGTDGNDYGVFVNGSFYLIPLPIDGPGQSLIPSSGTSNVYQDEASVFPCFAVGTRIATPDGARVVEELRPGDIVLASDGRAVPVRWVGHRTVGARSSAVSPQPVRIAAGALGRGLPHSDLTVTANHGLVLDGHVVTAGALVNGNGIDWVAPGDLPERFTVYHVETECHEVILANGAPAETFIDAAGRAAFDNHDEYLALYGAERIVPEMPLPRITSARLLPPALRARLGMDDDAQPIRRAG